MSKNEWEHFYVQFQHAPNIGFRCQIDNRISKWYPASSGTIKAFISFQIGTLFGIHNFPSLLNPEKKIDKVSPAELCVECYMELIWVQQRKRQIVYAKANG